MKKFTVEQWLEGDIPAAKECFSSSEWEKLLTKRKEIYFENIDQAYQSLVDNFQNILKDSLDAELLIRSSYESLKELLNPLQIQSETENAKTINGNSYGSTQIINFAGKYDVTQLRECYFNVLIGRHADDAIMCADIYKGLISNHLEMHIHACALHKLYKHFETEYSEILNPEIQYIGEKIKWLGSPSQFAYLFLQLIDGGFIELPKSKGDGSHAKLAEMCYEKFQMDAKLSSLRKELTPRGNSLTEANKIAFTIPNIKDLS